MYPSLIQFETRQLQLERELQLLRGRRRRTASAATAQKPGRLRVHLTPARQECR